MIRGRKHNLVRHWSDSLAARARRVWQACAERPVIGASLEPLPIRVEADRNRLQRDLRAR